MYRDGGNTELVVCSDRSPINKRFTSGYYVFVEGNLVPWKSKKLNVVDEDWR